MRFAQSQKAALEESNKKSHERFCEDIRQALLDLMETADYDQIKNTDIIKKAGVSRSAFYRTYYQKSDILIDIIQNRASDFTEHDTSDVYQNWEYIFRHIESNKHFYQLLVKNGLTGFILDQLNSQSIPEEDLIEQLLWNGMIYNTCVNWVKDGMKKSVDDMMDHIKNALSSIAQKVGK